MASRPPVEQPTIIRMRRRPAVVALDDLLGQYRHAADGDEFEVQRGLLILHEGAIERTTRTLMTGIGCGHGKATSQRRLISGGLSSGRFSDRAVQTAATLLQILSRPVVGKRDSEAGAVGLAVSCLCVDPSFRRCGNGPATPVRQRLPALRARVPPEPSRRG